MQEKCRDLALKAGCQSTYPSCEVRLRARGFASVQGRSEDGRKRETWGISKLNAKFEIWVLPKQVEWKRTHPTSFNRHVEKVLDVDSSDLSDRVAKNENQGNLSIVLFASQFSVWPTAFHFPLELRTLHNSGRFHLEAFHRWVPKEHHQRALFGLRSSHMA